MIIISILAAITLGALQKAHQAADVARTRSMIARLHNQIMIRWESYRTRRVPVATAGLGPQAAAAQRLSGIRELMRFELPERYSDIVDNPVVLTGLPKPASGDVPMWMTSAPQHGGVSAVSSAYLRRLMNNTDSTGAKAAPSTTYERAECLYMIITMNAEDDFAGIEQFKPKDSGDIDGDGMPEFHDAWGQPIEFLRRAPGFISDLQPSTDGNVGKGYDGNPDQSMNPRQPNTHHDPMDPLKLQKEAFTLFPLIYSGGIDRQTDIYRPSSPAGVPLPYSYTTTMFQVGSAKFRYDPYDSLKNSPTVSVMYPVGAPGDVDSDGDEGWADNIHNHLIGLR